MKVSKTALPSQYLQALLHDMHESKQMISEDPRILWNPGLSLGETQESFFHYFCQEFSD